ncbi:hypothetical protein CH352_05105 [Leptospira hartskeerlii]|uniref:Yip1 domain-containing protein n=1 Tax=Leptospira hartskeerlii TaxID=2023177 RepID=A0A2M9XFR0_9LEPT|nr:hypothetical protein [Leptospira hartskeerlii]PJZ26545.1 hypothetical protein CH357_03350 [Leptospira hartskeerlii]PJZ34972.1 hypothetical protein CH352_05105 [Leptospira hartskeerlii]
MNRILERLKELVRDNFYTRAFKKNLHYNLYPETILKETPKEFFRGVFRAFLLFLGTYVVFNLLVSLTNAAYLVEYGNRMRELYDQGKVSFTLYLMNSFPNSIFMLAVLFLIFQFYFASLSYFALWVLGEGERSFRRILGIAFSTSLYVLLAFYPILVLFNIVPNSFKKDPFSMVLFLSLNGIFFFGSIIVQSVFYVRMCRKVFGQNLGRALITWFLPFFLFATFIISSL